MIKNLFGVFMAVAVFMIWVLILFASSATASFDEASIDKARLLQYYGLTREAKVELINILSDGSADDESKSSAYYMLGNIAFEEGKISVALESWRNLVDQYPKSKSAMLVDDKINELSQIVEKSSDSYIDNAVASLYLRHGDFWSKGKQSVFSIDTSWISNVEAALKWYDKIISEFPRTDIACKAYEEKLRTVLGWKEPGRYGSKHGLKEFRGTYMPILLQIFSDFEKVCPEASTLQAFRFQIAQSYWKNREWSKTRDWLNLIIEKSEDSDSFYRDLAQRRLKKIEY